MPIKFLKEKFMRNKFIKNILISNVLFQHRGHPTTKKRRSKSAILTSKKTKQRKVKINQKNNQKSTEEAKKAFVGREIEIK